MRIEDIGKCPCCFDGKNVNPQIVHFYVARQENGDLAEIYIFGDDDFDMPSSHTTVTSVKFSEDEKKVEEVTCPRCKENILVNIPIIKKQSELIKPLSSKASPLVPANQAQMQCK